MFSSMTGAWNAVCGVLHRIEDGQDVGAVLRRSVDLAVGVDRRVPLVGGDHVVQVVLLVSQRAEGDDDVAFDALRPRRLGMRQLALGDPIGPLAQVLVSKGPECEQLAGHLFAGLAGHRAAHPRLGRRGELAEGGGDRARGFLTQLMTTDAAVVLHLVEPRRLRNGRRNLSVLAELVFGRDVQHRVPVDCGVILCGGGVVRRWRRGEIHQLSGSARHLRTVDETVAAHPYVVVRLRQIRDHVAPAIVGDDRLDIPDGQVARLGDDPHACLRPVRARDDAADVIAVNGDCRFLRL